VSLPALLDDLWSEIRTTLREFARALRSREGLVICIFIALVCARYLVHRSDWIGPLLETVHELGGRRPVRLRFLSVVLFGLAPMIAILIVHRENPMKRWGLGLPSRGWVLLTLAIFVLQIALIPWIASLPNNTGHYPLLKEARDPGIIFWQWQLLMIVSMASWEFLVRGYLLFGLRERFGMWAVLIQDIPFTILHFGKPVPELYFSFFDGLGLGLLAFASRSVWPAVFLHGAGAFLVDLWIVYGPGA
jgi:membrane protease YdiL (CAAX protease family)